jgi:hypothetical protein
MGFSKNDILSHIAAVPSAQAGLTTLFGMGRVRPAYSYKRLWYWAIIVMCLLFYKHQLHNILTY